MMLYIETSTISSFTSPNNPQLIDPPSLSHCADNSHLIPQILGNLVIVLKIF